MHEAGAHRTERIPRATGGISRLAYARLKEAGVAAEPLLKKAGLTVPQIEDAKLRLNVRSQIDYVEASTPRTFQHFTRHQQGASFGTKFEGLKVSRELPQQIAGLYHAGSVGIIMSGWLGAVNYGVIVANDVDGFLN